MSNDPWGLDKPEQSQTPKYAEHTIVKEDKGNWTQYDISLVPIEPEKQIKSYIKRSFLPDWTKITLPSLRAIFNSVASEERVEFMNRAMGEVSYIKYCWKEFKDYDKKAIAKKKDDGYEQHLDIDDQGREYIKHLGIHYLAIWFDEAEWRKDAESNEPVQEAEQPVSVVETNKVEAQGGAIATALPVIIEACGTDLTKLTQTLAHPPFNMSIQDAQVKQLVTNMVNDNCKGDFSQQLIMLAEINTHSDEPYLTVEELEIPF